MRTSRQPAAASTALLSALRERPAAQRVTLRVSASTSRARRSIAELIAAHGFAAQCRVSVAESHGVVVRWVDCLVTGTTEQVADFLATVEPVLARSHGEAALAA